MVRVAEQKSLLEASRWFTRERSSINDLHLQICRIPAPTFFEQQRAEWLRAQFEAWGWKAKLDRAGNVIASFGEEDRTRPFLVSAHLDTVYAPGRPEEVFISPDGRFIGPGVSDNGAGLAALMVLARVLPEMPELRHIAESTLLAANVGEEGEGNLSGMRYLCRPSVSLGAVRAFLVLDGPSIDHITAQALASRRFEIAFTGPGGHSWNDSGTPNPVHAISAAISTFSQFLENRSGAERKARLSYNFGIVEGGSSINSIPASARAKLDLRSEDPLVLDELTALLSSAVEAGLERENRAARGARLSAKIKELGSRPGGRLTTGFGAAGDDSRGGLSPEHPVESGLRFNRRQCSTVTGFAGRFHWGRRTGRRRSYARRVVSTGRARDRAQADSSDSRQSSRYRRAGGNQASVTRA